MLTYYLRPFHKVLIVGDKQLSVQAVTSNTVTLNYNGSEHTVRYASMYRLDPNLIVCYRSKDGNGCRLQVDSSLPVSLRKTA